MTTETPVMLEPALRFYLDHWDDMCALSELRDEETKPKSVTAEEWAKFEAVEDAACRSASDLLERFMADLGSSLPAGLGFRPYTRRGTVEEQWYTFASLALRNGGEEDAKIGLMIRRDRAAGTPALALVFWYRRDGLARANKLREAIADRVGWGRVPFAINVIEDVGPWGLLLAQWPLREDSIERITQELRAVALRLVEARSDLTAALCD